MNDDLRYTSEVQIPPPQVEATSAPRGARADATRAAIVEAAERLFRTLGYQKTTVADIARALRMSPANVYRFFPSKAAINEAIGLVFGYLQLDGDALRGCVVVLQRTQTMSTPRIFALTFSCQSPVMCSLTDESHVSNGASGSFAWFTSSIFSAASLSKS